jgi:hypothetical protein
MKSLIKNILQNRIFILFRNSMRIKPVRVSKYYLGKNISMSDAFLFRTDHGFKTLFRFSDVPKIFYDFKKTTIEFFFFDYSNNLIKKIEFNDLEKLNELLIDSAFLNGKETYGHFYIFHNIKDMNLEKISLSNRCYLGYSYKNNNYSFVHGNMYVKSKDLNSGNISSNFSNLSLFLNSKYVIQESFNNIDRVELFIVNPVNKKISIIVNKKKYLLNGDCDLKLSYVKIEKIEILSNCLNLRPVVFTYKNNFYDVHHA